MQEQSALALGRILVWELTRLRVETLIVGGGHQTTVAPGIVAEAAPAGTVRPTDPPVGKVPPTDPQRLIDEVRRRVTGSLQLETVVAAAHTAVVAAPDTAVVAAPDTAVVAAPDTAVVAAPDTAGDEVAARRLDALALLREIQPIREIQPDDRAQLESGGPAPRRGTTPPQLDQTQARRLARHWELGQRRVACRTLVTMDGDAVTQFPAEFPGGHGVSHGALVRAHRAIALSAMTWWPVLFRTAGRLAAAVIPRRPRLDVLLWWRQEPKEHGGEKRFPWPEFVSHCQSFLAWGRVVFESPSAGDGASIRSMVHPSGDIETTILQDATDELLASHVAMVASWVRRMETSLRQFTAWVEWLAVGFWALVIIVPAGVSFTATRPILVGIAPPVLGALFGWVVRWGLQRWLQRKLTSLTQPVSDGVQSTVGA